MAALRGFIQGDDAKAVSRLGHRVIEADLRTWDRKVVLTLHADGSYNVVERELHSGVPVGSPLTITERGPSDA